MSNDKITAAAREPYDAMGPIDAPNPPAARAPLADVQPGGRVTLGDQAERAPWRSMDTCPRDGTVVRLRWGEDHVSPGWWSAPVSPVQNDDGTWPSDTGGFPWAFIDFNNGSAFVNHAVDTEYGPTHWAPYAALSAQPSPGGQGGAVTASMIDAAIAAFFKGHAWSAIGDRVAVEAKMRGTLEAALAARQPVGQERVAWASTGATGHKVVAMPGLHKLPYGDYDLYAAPPAQAVDLAQFREPIAAWSKHCAHSIKGYESYQDSDLPDWMAERRQQVRKCGELLALIDSQAVGNG